VTLTIVGKGMTEPVEPIDPHGHPHPPDAAEFHKPDVKPGSSPLCAPDGLTPRGSRPGPVVATCILVALVAWVGSVRRAPR